MDGANRIDIAGKFSFSASRPFQRERYNPLIEREKTATAINAFILPSKLRRCRIGSVSSSTALWRLRLAPDSVDGRAGGDTMRSFAISLVALADPAG
jgi:hypothetical protein